MPAERRERPALDPFVFPSETKGRFTMLIMAALAFGANLGIFLHAAIFGNAQFIALTARALSAIQQWRGKSVLDASAAELKTFAQQQTIFARDSLWACAEVLTLPVLLVLLLIGVAATFYYGHAKRLRNRYRTQPLTKAESPMVVADLESYAHRNGLSLPQLEYTSGLAQGHSFGTKGGEVLLLHGTPAMLESSWGEANRAIALHELAHIANADAQEREKAKAVWKAFVIVLLGALALLLAFGIRLSSSALIRVLGMLIFVRALWAGLIRTREFYADWRAASWGAGPALMGLFDLPEGENNPWERYRWWWQAWERWGDRVWWRAGGEALDWCWRLARWSLQLHPSFSTRGKVLRNPARLFRISPDLSLLTGALLTIVMVGSLLIIVNALLVVGAVFALFQSAVFRFLADLPLGTTRDLLLVGAMVTLSLLLLTALTSVLLIPSYLITRTIGVQLQRNAAAGLATGEVKGWGYARLLPAAFLLSIGVETGLHIAPFSPFTSASHESWAAIPVWLVGFTILLWLWLAYVHGLSRMLLGSYAGRKRPRNRQALVTLSSVALLTVLYWPALLARLTLQLLPLAHAGGRLPFNMEPRRVFAYGFFFTTLIVLVFALLVYLTWILASMALMRIGLMRRKKRCPTCGEEIVYILNLGRRCRGCNEILGPWIFLCDQPAAPESGR
jgi:hypothetical protein